MDKNHREIRGNNFAIDYFVNEGTASFMLFNLYGENGLFELIKISKIYIWQIFDTGNGEMIDLENPSKNGSENSQKYHSNVLKSQ